MKKRAVDCFKAAAFSGDAEACWQLGQLALEGSYVLLAEEAPVWFARSFADAPGAIKDMLLDSGRISEVSDAEIELDLLANYGLAALGLAETFRDGCGVVQDFDEALCWARRARLWLEEVVEGGNWYHKRHLVSARKLERFLFQELYLCGCC